MRLLLRDESGTGANVETIGSMRTVINTGRCVIALQRIAMHRLPIDIPGASGGLRPSALSTAVVTLPFIAAP